jgi:hypothetical protein
MTATAHEVKQEVERRARSPWMQRLARAGLVAQGISFAIVAVIALNVALAGGKLEDRPGALQTLADERFGRFLLGALAVGLGGYALWRFAQALLGEKLETGEDVNVWKRIGYAARGVLYAWFSFICTSLVLNADEPAAGGAGQGEEDRATAWVLEQPLGRWAVAAVGFAIVGAGLFNFFRALTQKFRKDLKEAQMGRQERRWYTAIGVVGHLARGLVFALIGFFLVKAAYEYDPKEAIGLDGALRKVVEASYGPFLLTVVAAGLMAYALFCLVQARYREV